HVVKQPGGDGDDVELHVGQEVGDGERMDEVWLAGMTDLSTVLERREYVGPAKELDIGIRAVCPDFFEQILESNHEKRCLTPGTASGPGVDGRACRPVRTRTIVSATKGAACVLFRERRSR